MAVRKDIITPRAGFRQEQDPAQNGKSFGYFDSVGVQRDFTVGMNRFGIAWAIRPAGVGYRPQAAG
jgi:hypothetical protein